LRGAEILETLFIAANLTNADLRGAYIRGAEMNRAILDGVRSDHGPDHGSG
jgi:uncharacterized protein YjbI with pentapeptide repeats